MSAPVTRFASIPSATTAWASASSRVTARSPSARSTSGAWNRPSLAAHRRPEVRERGRLLVADDPLKPLVRLVVRGESLFVERLEIGTEQLFGVGLGRQVPDILGVSRRNIRPQHTSYRAGWGICSCCRRCL